MSYRFKILSLSIALAIPLSAAPAISQSAQTVLERVQEQYEKRMSGIDNYTIMHDVMGFESTAYFEKTTVDGNVVFRSPDDDDEEGISQFYSELDKVAEKSTLEGKENVDGEECYVVAIDDFSDLDLEMTPEEEQEFTPKKGTFFIDTDDYILRKVRLDGEVMQEGQAREATMLAAFQDYRDVEGMLYPFRTVVSVEGAVPGASEEDLRKAQEQMQQLEEQLESMPEAQRKAVEGMIKPQLEKLKQMVESGKMEFTLEVKELKVNAGPPAEG